MSYKHPYAICLKPPGCFCRDLSYWPLSQKIWKCVCLSFFKTYITDLVDKLEQHTCKLVQTSSFPSVFVFAKRLEVDPFVSSAWHWHMPSRKSACRHGFPEGWVESMSLQKNNEETWKSHVLLLPLIDKIRLSSWCGKTQENPMTLSINRISCSSFIKSWTEPAASVQKLSFSVSAMDDKSAPVQWIS